MTRKVLVTRGRSGRLDGDVSEDEPALVKGLRSQDPLAFNRVYELYRPRVFGFLLRLAGRRDLAEDLLQECFVRLAKSAHRLEEDTRLAAWLFRVARNLFISHRRACLIDLDRIAELRLLATVAETPISAFDVSAARQLERKLERALLALPIKYREIILLVAVEGMEPAEVAVVLNLKPEALRQRLKRARDMLRKRLTREDAERAPALEIRSAP